MSNTANYSATIDTSQLDAKFKNLVSRMQREIMMKALKAGAEELQRYTQEALLSKFPKAKTAKGKGKRVMIDDVHIVTDKAIQEVMVSVMNYLTKWYEMGTQQRFLKDNHPKDEKHHKTYKKGESRGQIKPLHYFREARQNHEQDVIDAICKIVLEEVSKFNE